MQSALAIHPTIAPNAIRTISYKNTHVYQNAQMDTICGLEDAKIVPHLAQSAHPRPSVLNAQRVFGYLKEYAPKYVPQDTTIPQFQLIPVSPALTNIAQAAFKVPQIVQQHHFNLPPPARSAQMATI